jgi:hypothetical protein
MGCSPSKVRQNELIVEIIDTNPDSKVEDVILSTESKLEIKPSSNNLPRKRQYTGESYEIPFLKLISHSENDNRGKKSAKPRPILSSSYKRKREPTEIAVILAQNEARVEINRQRGQRKR